MRLRLLIALLLLSLVVSPTLQAKEPKLVVGSKKSFTESIIWGEILKHVAESCSLKAEHKQVSGTQLLFKALQRGEIDVYADYTGTLASEVLAQDNIRDEEALRASLASRGIGVTGHMGFSNNYALGMKEALGKERKLSKISDLALPENEDLKFGFSDEFMKRGDGWPGLQRRYGLKQQPRGMDHNLALRGIESSTLDVTDLFSTDPEIQLHHLHVLEDDLGYFPSYHCVVLYRLDLAERSPQLVEALQKLVGSMDNARMTEMNALVQLNGKSEDEVAARFLQEKVGLDVQAHKHPIYADILRYTLDHLLLVGASLFSAIVVAIPLGIWARTRPRAGKFILAIVGIVQTLPSLAVLMVMVPILGLTPQSAIVALFLYSLLPIVRNTYQGLTEIPANFRESAEVLGLPSRARLWLIELPLASPSIMAGIKTAAVINVGTATLGAFIGAGGYGEPIQTGLRLNNPWLIAQGAIPAAILAVTIQWLFDFAERFVVPKGLRIK